MITLSGGFHNVAAIRINWIPGQDLSHAQFRKIQKHFCGMSDCKCGGALRKFDCDQTAEIARQFALELQSASI